MGTSNILTTRLPPNARPPISLMNARILICVLCLTVCANTQDNHVGLEWTPSHCDESEACNAQEYEHIRRNNEVDLQAKMALDCPCQTMTCMTGATLPYAVDLCPPPSANGSFTDTELWCSQAHSRHHGTCRMLFLCRPWGHMRWGKTGPPWEHISPKCPPWHYSASSPHPPHALESGIL